MLTAVAFNLRGIRHVDQAASGQVDHEDAQVGRALHGFDVELCTDVLLDVVEPAGLLDELPDLGPDFVEPVVHARPRVQDHVLAVEASAEDALTGHDCHVRAKMVLVERHRVCHVR